MTILHFSSSTLLCLMFDFFAALLGVSIRSCLGLDDYYFKTISDESIASHILSIYSAKILAETVGDKFNLRIQNEHPEDALYIVPSFPGVLATPSQDVEYRLELNYLGEG